MTAVIVPPSTTGIGCSCAALFVSLSWYIRFSALLALNAAAVDQARSRKFSFVLNVPVPEWCQISLFQEEEAVL